MDSEREFNMAVLAEKISNGIPYFDNSLGFTKPNGMDQVVDLEYSLEYTNLSTQNVS